MLDYRDYLEHRYLDEFDVWAKSYVNPYADLRGETAYRNWDSAARLRELEDDGVVAEVLFPNTIPPFFPSGNLLARPPTPETYELRWAGLRAHNRWLADFCADAPGRRAGMAQVFLNDVDDAVAEISWAANMVSSVGCCSRECHQTRDSRRSVRLTTSASGPLARISTCR